MTWKTIAAFLLSLIPMIPAFAGWENGKYGDAFWDIGVGARGLGMGSAQTAAVSDITAVFWNPAGLTHLQESQLHIMHSERFAGMVNWDFASIGVPLHSGAVIGLGFFRLAVDDIAETQLTDPDRSLGDVYLNENGDKVRNVPYTVSSLSDQEMALTATYAFRHSDKLSVGLNAKLLRKTLGHTSAWGMGFDAGIQYAVTSRLRYGIRLADITHTILVWQNGRKEVIYPKLIQGVSCAFTIGDFSLLQAVDFLMTFHNLERGAQFYYNTVGLDLYAGMEIEYHSMFALRAGMDRGRAALGAGVTVSGFSVDYGFASQSSLGQSHRVSLTVRNLKKLRPGF